MEFHQEELLKSCRVCGRRLKSAKGVGRAFDCSSKKTLLVETFGIDIGGDDSAIHPPQFCFSCEGVTRRKIAVDKKGVPYKTHAMHNVYQWSMHREENCNVRETK